MRRPVKERALTFKERLRDAAALAGTAAILAVCPVSCMVSFGRGCAGEVSHWNRTGVLEESITKGEITPKCLKSKNLLAHLENRFGEFAAEPVSESLPKAVDIHLVELEHARNDSDMENSVRKLSRNLDELLARVALRSSTRLQAADGIITWITYPGTGPIANNAALYSSTRGRVRPLFDEVKRECSRIQE